jgi:hypothetical protein
LSGFDHLCMYFVSLTSPALHCNIRAVALAPDVDLVAPLFLCPGRKLLNWQTANAFRVGMSLWPDHTTSVNFFTVSGTFDLNGIYSSVGKLGCTTTKSALPR